MVEMIVVVAVVAILAGMTAPAYVEMINRQRIQSEENTQQEIFRAMKVFSKQYGRLPSEYTAQNAFCNTTNNTWDECLALVSNLSAQQILVDTWGRDRAYIRAQENNAVLLGSTVSFDYVSILSSGPDQEADAAAGIATLGTDYAAVGNSNWWARGVTTMAQKLAEFRVLEAGGDDILIKYANRSDRMEEYELVLERIKAISSALESYARVKYNEATIPPAEANAEKKIFYPPSYRVRASLPARPDDPIASYGTAVAADLPTSRFGSDGRVENRASQEADRRDEMIELMRLLGLPDSYCCNAMQQVSIGSEWVESALYYYSNPEATTNGTSCIGYRGAASQANPRYLPARVTTEPYVCP